MDYAILPPEINSSRMYAGAGSGPMTTAATAWDRLAATLSSAAASYRAVVSELTDGFWQGPASASMAAAAEPYLEWMSATAVQAEHTASQARAAAAAYEAAFAATVPPPAVAANRATLATLVATNFFGQNTPAIAANQAEYGEMWAQDATAMYNYTGSSLTATTLTPLSAAPQTTDPAGPAGQAAAAQAAATSAQAAASTVAQSGSSILDWDPFGAIANSPLLDNATVSGLNGLFNATGALTLQSAGPFIASEGVQIFLIPLMTATGKLAMLGPMAAMGAATGAGLASSVSPGASTAILADSYQSGVSASLGHAAPLGKLSVPPSWGVAPQEVRLASATLPTASPMALPNSGMATPMAPPMMGGPIGSVVNTPKNADPRLRSGSSLTAVSKNLGGADVDETTRSRWAQGASGAASGLSEREQAELDQLREEMDDMARECDAVARLMREAMH